MIFKNLERFDMQKKKKNLDTLINAVVALYLNLLRLDMENIGKREVDIV
jgi:hypothetical protein